MNLQLKDLFFRKVFCINGISYSLEVLTKRSKEYSRSLAMSFDSFPTIEVTFMIPQGVSKLFLLMLQILYIVLLNYFNVQNFSKLKHKPRDLQIKVYNEVFFIIIQSKYTVEVLYCILHFFSWNLISKWNIKLYSYWLVANSDDS